MIDSASLRVSRTRDAVCWGFAGLHAIAGVAFLRHGLANKRPYGTYTSSLALIVFLAMIDTQYSPVTSHLLTVVAILALFCLPPSLA